MATPLGLEVLEGEIVSEDLSNRGERDNRSRITSSMLDELQMFFEAQYRHELGLERQRWLSEEALQD